MGTFTSKILQTKNSFFSFSIADHTPTWIWQNLCQVPLKKIFSKEMIYSKKKVSTFRSLKNIFFNDETILPKIIIRLITKKCRGRVTNTNNLWIHKIKRPMKGKKEEEKDEKKWMRLRHTFEKQNWVSSTDIGRTLHYCAIIFHLTRTFRHDLFFA